MTITKITQEMGFSLVPIQNASDPGCVEEIAAG